MIEKTSFRGDDYDFAAGSIQGLRSWKIDEQGRLRGVTHAEKWRPGENVSTCRNPAATERHDFDADCECGFWAYDEIGYQAHGDISGVIEGYGKTTIGTKGFRAQKARIVALCRDFDDDYLPLSTWLRLKRLYPEARFFEDFDDMVAAHGAVMKTWDTPGDDFWDDDYADRRERYSLGGLVYSPHSATSMRQSLAALQRYMTP